MVLSKQVQEHPKEKILDNPLKYIGCEEPPKRAAQLVESLGSRAWLYQGLKFDPPGELWNSTLCCLLGHGFGGASLPPSLGPGHGGPMIHVDAGVWVIKEKEKYKAAKQLQ